MSNTRGRPKQSNKIIEVNDIKCEFIISKTDKYENEVSFLKIVDKGYRQKLKQIFEQDCPECKLPLFKTDDDLYMLKVKNKFMPKREFENNELLNCNITFNHYCFNTENDKLLQGYYCKLQVIEDNVNN